MIRVLHVVTYMGRGGIETMLMNYYRHIDRTKVQFDFLTHRDFIADYDNEIESLGGKIYHLPVLNPFSSQYNRALNDFFNNHSEYKIVHVHQDCMSSVVLKAAQKNGVPVRIAHSHNTDQSKNVKYLLKMIYMKYIPRYATKMMACSEAAGNWMFGGEDFEILPNAIEADIFRFQEEKRRTLRKLFEIKNQELLIGHVGNFSVAKNHLFILDVFAEINKIFPAKLLLIGDGPFRKKIEKKIKSLGLYQKVIIAGVRSDVADLMQTMDVFIFPSLFEGLSVSVIEAQAAGIPCVISDRVPDECIITNIVHQLSLNNSPKMWAQSTIAVAKTGRCDTYNQIVKAGYDIHENAKKLTDFYCNLSICEK